MNKRPYTVVLTGPESTGKTTLAEQLARHFGGTWIPEYARTYVETINRPYAYRDVIHIVRHQIEVLKNPDMPGNPFLFLDTDLIILKIWFHVVYGHVPEGLQEAIRKRKIDLYLLCRPDIPWVSDPVRENPGRKREELYVMYEEEIRGGGFAYKVVSGRGEERFRNAVASVVSEIYNKH